MADLSFFVRSIRKTYFSCCTTRAYININTSITILTEKIIAKGKKYLLLFLIIIFIQSCQDQYPISPEDQPNVILEALDVSCTEVWLQLKLQNLKLPVSVTMHENQLSYTDTLLLTSTDTIVCIDSLLPGSNYSYSYSLTYQGKNYISDTVLVKTMDTTSNNYTWQSLTFGDIGSSSFSDCAIINENDIWCVGEIMLRDTSENGYSIYNAVHWDGNTWTINKIMFYTECSLSYKNAYPASAIQVFPGNEALVTVEGNQVAKLENGVQDKIFCVPGTMLIKTLWGQSVDDFYVTGEEGEIAHYENGIWTTLNSGTEYNINAVWGNNNTVTGELEVLAAAGNINHGSEPDREILKIVNNIVEKINADDAKWPLSGIWFKSGQKYIVTGAGVFTKENKMPYNYRLEESLTQFYIKELCGDLLNNIWAVGDYGEVLHFNGSSWHSFIGGTYINGTYVGVDVKGPIIVTVGSTNSTAIVTIGKAKN